MANQSKRVGTLAGALAKDPRGGRVSTMPVGNSVAAGNAAGVAKAAELQRVSPGVYRNAQGGLVNSRGGSLPGQRPQQPQRPSMNVPAPRPQRQPGPGQFLPANPSQYPNGQQQPSWRAPAPMAGQNAANLANDMANIPPESYGEYQRYAVMPDRKSSWGSTSWDGQGNGPGSPSNLNQWSTPQFDQNQFNMLMQQMQQRASQMPGSQYGMYQQQGQQQPNTVSGMLQQGGQQPQQQPAPNPYIKQY